MVEPGFNPSFEGCMLAARSTPEVARQFEGVRPEVLNST
jgi:hypothetical protein